MHQIKEFEPFFINKGTKLCKVINADPPATLSVPCFEYKTDFIHFFEMLTNLLKEKHWLTSFWGKCFGSRYRLFEVENALRILQEQIQLDFSWRD